jgi:hypothetical protein
MSVKKILSPGPTGRVKVWGRGVEGYFHEKSLRKSVRSRHSLRKTEKF